MLLVPCSVRRSSQSIPNEQPLPNKRLKLAGGYRSNGNGVFVPLRGRSVVQHPCAGGRVARSLSAIR